MAFVGNTFQETPVLEDSVALAAGRLFRTPRSDYPAKLLPAQPGGAYAETADVRWLPGRSSGPPIRGHASSVPRHGLLGVGSLKQLPKSVLQ